MPKATCSVLECTRAHYARTYCKAHYVRVLETGDPQEWKPLRKLPTAGEREDIASRILRRSTASESGCIEWNGRTSDTGYGRISWGGKWWMVHRAMWTVTVADIPTDDDWTIDHLCSNRRCVNVDHMEVVTRTVNAERGGGLAIAIAVRRSVTHCKRGHEFTDANTIRLSRGGRLCRTCNKRRWAEKSSAINASRRAGRAA